MVEHSKLELQQAMQVANGENNQNQLIQTSEGKNKTPYAISKAEKLFKTRLRKSLRSKEGKQVCAVLNRSLIDPESLFVWSKDPEQLVNGLANVFRKLKSQYQVVVSQFDDKPQRNRAGGDSGASRAVQKKCDELQVKLHNAESARTKSNIRLMALLSKFATEATAAKGGGSTTFLTAVDDEPAAASSNEMVLSKKQDVSKQALRDVLGNTYIRLSDNYLQDSDIKELTELVATTQRVTEFDLTKNKLTEKGALNLVEAAIKPTSVVTLLNLQHNHVTIAGLESISQMLLSMAAPGDVHDKQDVSLLSASLQKENKKYLPVLELKLAGDRTLIADFRHNSLQAGQSQASVKNAINRIVRSLRQAGGAASGDAEEDDVNASFASVNERKDDISNLPGYEGLFGDDDESDERALVLAGDSSAFEDLFNSKDIRKKLSKARSSSDLKHSESSLRFPKVDFGSPPKMNHSLSLRVLPKPGEMVGSNMQKSKSVAKLKGVYGGNLPGLERLFENVDHKSSTKSGSRSIRKTKSKSGKSKGSLGKGERSKSASRLRKGSGSSSGLKSTSKLGASKGSGNKKTEKQKQQNTSSSKKA